MAQSEPQPNAETTQRRAASSEPQIRVVFDKFQAFVDEYRPKISLGGVFLESSQPHPVGTRVSCEFQLADGFRLCRAVGEVAWRRPTAGGTGRPAGMGIRFLALDGQGRELVLKILEEQVKGGGEPFEVERVPPDAEAESPPQGPREDPASTHSRPAVVSPSEPSSAAGATAADEFKAPWGQELPALPDDVIEPPLEDDVLTTAYDDFDSDLSEAGFAADTDLFDVEGPAAAPEPTEAPDEVSFSDEALDEKAQIPSFDVASSETPSFEPDTPAELPDFDDMDESLSAEPAGSSAEPVPVPAEPVGPSAEPLGVSDEEEAVPDDPSELLSGLGLPSSEPSAPADAEDEAPISHFGLPEPPSSMSSSWPESDDDRAWEGHEEDTEWEEGHDSGLRGVLDRTQITLAESSGRFLLILFLLVTTGAVVLFKEQILTWVGLGSPPAREVSRAPLAEPEEERRESMPAAGEPAAGEPAAGEPAAGEPAAAGQEPSGQESAEPEVGPELIDVGAETAATPPASQLRPPPAGSAAPHGEPPAAEMDALAPATRVQRITYDQAAEGTRVTVWLDGHLAAARYEYQELSYAPRKEQLVLSGIGTPYASRVEVGTLELDRIRTGLHDGSRLNLVFDLSSEHMTLAEIRSRGDRLEILVRRR